MTGPLEPRPPEIAFRRSEALGEKNIISDSTRESAEARLAKARAAFAGYEAAIAAGPSGDFLIAFDDNEVFGTSSRGIYGWLWGNRAYLPGVLRN